MITIDSFTFGPFQENTYVLSNDTGDCFIIDPGCYTSEEESTLADHIERRSLKPVRLLNTHCHVDHIFGNNFIHRKFGLRPFIHELDLPLLNQLENVCRLYGLHATASPEPEGFLNEGETLSLGDDNFEIFHTPGHSPGSVVFLHRSQGFMISGDVLFYESIGRSDLPGGNHDQLIRSIRNKVFTLGDHLEVWPGHGPSTTIAHEKLHNPFVNGS